MSGCGCLLRSAETVGLAWMDRGEASIADSLANGWQLCRVNQWQCPCEYSSWRSQDILTQAQLPHDSGHTLGSRVLIRSALETLEILIHLNQVTGRVLDGSLDFHIFDKKTRELLLGSRDGSTSHKSMNIVTVLSHCKKKYEGISGIYAVLSESAHPNYEGVCVGYSKIEREAHETNFTNRWPALWS